MVEINFEKLKIEVQSIEQSSNDKVGAMKNLLVEMEATIKEEIGTRDQLLAQRDALETEVEQLTSTQSNLQQESGTLTDAITGLKIRLQGLETQYAELKTKKDEVERAAGEYAVSSESVLAEIAETEQSIAKEEALASHAKEEAVTKQQEFEAEIAGLQKQREGEEYFSKILKNFLQEGYVNSSYYDVCKVLTQQGVNNLDRLVMSSGVDRNTVVETLQDLSARRLLGFTPGSGEFEIIKQFEL